MAACWRALGAREGIDLHVVHLESLTGKPTPFDIDRVMQGISNRRFRRSDPNIDQFLRGVVSAHQPDVVVLCGWIYWPYTRLLFAPELANSRFILGMDSPWVGSIWQRVAKLRLRPLWCRVSILSSPPASGSAEYARRIGVPRRGFAAATTGSTSTHFRMARRRLSIAAPIPVRRPLCRSQGFADAGARVPAVSRPRERSLAADLPGHRSGCGIATPSSRASPTPDSCSRRSCRRRFAITACLSCRAATSRGASSSPKPRRRDCR